MTAEALVPVTVIGGYLGAGKTTLVNRLLGGGHGLRLAVLVNDFGAVNVDADLIASHDGDTISLTNGCVCCSIADALGDALDRVLSLDPAPDQIVIEASGVSDPANIAAYGQGWPGCRLDTVVVLADAETIRARSTDQFVGELVVRQLRRGDVVVVTKCDLLPEEEAQAVRDWAASLGNTPVLTARDGLIDPAVLLDLPSELPSGRGDRPHATTRPQFVGTGPDVTTRFDAELFDTVVLQLDEGVTRDRLEAALERWGDEVIRVKGIVAIGEDGAAERAPHVVQRVGRRWTIEPAPAAGGTAAGRLVVIGRRGVLDGARLGADLR